MFKKIMMASSLLTSNAYAHVGTENNMQHAAEHLLILVLLVPAAWLIMRSLLERKDNQ